MQQATAVTLSLGSYLTLSNLFQKKTANLKPFFANKEKSPDWVIVTSHGKPRICVLTSLNTKTS